MAQLIQPTDRLTDTFPGLGFRDAFSFTTNGEPVIVCDPIAIADVFNATSGSAAFLRSRGVFFADVGGDTSGPIVWRAPFLVLRVATNSESEFDDEAHTLADEVKTDSGCFMFLPFTVETPEEVRANAVRAQEQGDAAIIDVPPGEWAFFYEQLATPTGSSPEFYRNIVARHSSVA